MPPLMLPTFELEADGIAVGYETDTPAPGVVEVRWTVRGPAGMIDGLTDVSGVGERRDGLWQTTCFELFFGGLGEAGYHELNVAPSGHWALYGFDDVRRGMRPLDNEVLSVRGAFDDEGYTLTARFAYDWGRDPSTIFFGTAVISRGGIVTYWSGMPSREVPDFHADFAAVKARAA